MQHESRLKFSKDEQPEKEQKSKQPKKPVHRTDKEAVRADKAQVDAPKRKSKQRCYDPATNTVSTTLQFDKKKPPSKLRHVAATTPVGLAATSFHRSVQRYENDNVGVESAHRLEESAETSGRLVQSAHRSRQHRKARAAVRSESRLQKAKLDALYQKAQTAFPTSNPVSRWRQKQAIRKQYAAAKTGKAAHTTYKTAGNTTKAAKKTAQESKKTGQFVWRHRKGLSIALAIGLMAAFLLNSLSSCSMLVQSGGSGVALSTYPAQDADILGAEAAYCALETDLQSSLDNYEAAHDYDEYRYDLDEIGHDPYVLISIISALHPSEWALDEVQGTLQMLFGQQYILTESVEVETRTVTADDGTTAQEEYSICTVTLENFNLSHVPVYIMGEDQLGMYATYMATLGNRPDLFADSQYVGLYADGNYLHYDVPPEALEDEVFAAMLREAEKYLGYPYVWGGSSPSTSFDCSGYVSWVINHSGWNVGRLGAQGLCNICTPVSAANARPGDLVFFKHTYAAPDPDGVTHVGIYVGNSMMIHCGDPISYANLNENYWQQHFYCYGRLP